MNQINLIKTDLKKLLFHFNCLCKKVNVDYTLMGGSALGAVRHSDIIPWDDDIDIFMKYPDYINFLNIKLLESDLFYLKSENTPSNPYFFSKFCFKNTHVIETTMPLLNEENGIFLDIIPLVGAYNSKILRILQFSFAKILNAYALSQTNYSTSSIFKRIFIYIFSYLNKGLINFIHSFVVGCDYNSATEVCHLFGRAKYKNSFYLKAWFEKNNLILFGDGNYPVAHGVYSYLNKRYGDNFMEIPEQSIIESYPSHIIRYYKLVE
jgi:lipopolysaccharide cholinephosphotransferase